MRPERREPLPALRARRDSRCLKPVTFGPLPSGPQHFHNCLFFQGFPCLYETFHPFVYLHPISQIKRAVPGGLSFAWNKRWPWTLANIILAVSVVSALPLQNCVVGPLLLRVS